MNPIARHLLIALHAAMTLSGFADAGTPAEQLLKQPDAWFQSQEGRTQLDNLLSWQTERGDWPKNMDTTRQSYSGDAEKPAGTFDNGATSGELRVLAHAYRVTADEKYKRAFMRGLDHILRAQYANGGWPQYYPLSKKYHRHITFNDNTMVRLLEFLRDVSSEKDFDWVDEARRTDAASAVDRGVQCIVDCQVIVDGQRTVWCAQHDAETLAATQARSYELASLSGSESAGILRFLMSIEEPAADVIVAVNAGVAWFEKSKTEGFRYRRSKSEPALSVDPNAKPLWARFYEIQSNRPIFSDRDGIVKYDIQEIGSERRGGYTWYGNWGENVLKSYARWPHR